MATAKKAAAAKKVAAQPVSGPAEVVEPLSAAPAVPVEKVAARKVAAKKTAAKKAAVEKAVLVKAMPPAEPSARTRIAPTAAWPFPIGNRP